MPRRGSSDVRCTVAGCRCEWIEVSKNRHLYCHEHMLQANALYAEYKAANATALATFADDALDQCIRLREEYARRFLDYEDMGAHRAYIGILRRVRSACSVAAEAACSVAAEAACSVAAEAACSVAAEAACSVAAEAACSVAAEAACSVAAEAACSVAAEAACAACQCSATACRRAAYNRWMTESAYFSDFARA